MDAGKNLLQDVIRCVKCDDKIPELYCQLCDIRLCKVCAPEHILDDDDKKNHNVVSLRKHKKNPQIRRCHEHPDSQCTLHCEQCAISLCPKCTSNGDHEHHKIIDVLTKFENKKEALRIMLTELEQHILPKYKMAALDIDGKKADLSTKVNTLKTTLVSQKEVWLSEIEAIIKNMQSEIEDMSRTHLAFLEFHEKNIKETTDELSRAISDLKTTMDSTDACQVSEYNCKITKFRKLPVQINVCLPNFFPESISRETFGSLSKLSTDTIECLYATESFESEFFPPGRQLLDEPLVTSHIEKDKGEIYHVSCLSDEKVWTSGSSKVMELYDLQRNLLHSTNTKSGNAPDDITVAKSGDLYYIDSKDKSVNVYKNKKVESVITVKKWIPLGICSGFFGDLLVIMDSDDRKQTKIVRYSDSKEIQSIQYDDKNPFHSSAFIKYLTENRNFDICVADWVASAVVVVNADGEFRFRYPESSSTHKSFQPRGITTDSQGMILIADGKTPRIHIIERNGRFLKFVGSGVLRCPRGLCVDSKDNLFVAETIRKSKVNIIQYYK